VGKTWGRISDLELWQLRQGWVRRRCSQGSIALTCAAMEFPRAALV